MASIDNADWHTGGNYPADLPHENGGTHIGMYLAWVIHRGMGSAALARLAGGLLEGVRQRRISGRRVLFEALDGKFFPRLLRKEALAFTRSYYESNAYFEDYAQTLGGELPTLYHVEDGWTNYDKLAPVLDARFRAWRASRPGS